MMKTDIRAFTRLGSTYNILGRLGECIFGFSAGADLHAAYRVLCSEEGLRVGQRQEDFVVGAIAGCDDAYYGCG